MFSDKVVKTSSSKILKTKTKTRKNREKKKNFHSHTQCIRTRTPPVLQFQKKITIVFLETIIMIKLYHWKTHVYASHKATDKLYTKLNENMDKFMEVLFGKSGHRMNLTKTKKISLIDMHSKEELIQNINKLKSYLVSLNEKIDFFMTNSDLLNIRDEILGDLNQFLYLLSFH
jgi:hypothetical protein